MLNRLQEMWKQRQQREALYSTAAYWDHKAETFRGKAVSMWPNNILNALYEEEDEVEIRRRLGDVRGLELLDLGCGTGRMSRWFADQGARVTGLDFSAGALAIARSESREGNPTYQQGSIFELPFENAFDVVFVWGVITTACRNDAQVLDAMRRIRRALRPGGRLLVTEPVHKGFLHRVLDMNVPTFLSIMREAGFDVKMVRPLHFWPVRLLLSYVAWPGWITRPVYRIGHASMKLPGLSKLGDYTFILAAPRAQ